MRPADHIYSELEAIARSLKAANARAPEKYLASNFSAIESAKTIFLRLAVPILGESAASELFVWWSERHGTAGEPRFEKLAHIGSFLIGDYDEEKMDLDAEDWAYIRDSISAEAEEMNMDTLSRLMTDLVDRGALH